MDDTDVYDGIMGTDDPSLAKAQALVNQIRGQRQLAAMTAVVPQLSGLSRTLEGNANAAGSDLGAGENARQIAQGLDPDSLSSQIGRQVASTMGVQVPEGAPLASYQGLFPELARSLQARAMADYHNALLGQKSGEVITTHDAYGNPIKVLKYGGGAGPMGNAGPGSGSGGAGAGGGAGPLTPQALDQAAEQFHRTGVIARGTPKPLVLAIRNRAAQLHPDADLASNAANYGADQKSLTSQQKLLDLTNSWESTGHANLGVLKDISGQLASVGSPLLNKPLRWLYENVAGDPMVTKFKAAHSAVVNEYAKILSGNTGGGGVTEGARHEAEEMLPLSSTPAQIAAAADVLEQDAGNRLSALRGQVAATQARMSSKPPSAGASSSAPAASNGPVRISSDAEYNSLPSGAEFIGPDGKHRRKP